MANIITPPATSSNFIGISPYTMHTLYHGQRQQSSAVCQRCVNI